MSSKSKFTYEQIVDYCNKASGVIRELGKDKFIKIAIDELEESRLSIRNKYNLGDDYISPSIMSSNKYSDYVKITYSTLILVELLYEYAIAETMDFLDYQDDDDFVLKMFKNIKNIEEKINKQML